MESRGRWSCSWFVFLDWEETSGRDNLLNSHSRLSHFDTDVRDMILLFLLILTFRNGVATEEANLRQLMNSLQMNMNEISSKMTMFETKVENLENEIKVGVVLENFKVE